MQLSRGLNDLPGLEDSMKIIKKPTGYSIYINHVKETDLISRSELETWLLNVYPALSPMDNDDKEFVMQQINRALCQ